MKTIIAFILVLFFSKAFAQGWAENTRFKTGTWTTINLKYPLAPRVNLFAEGQIRSQRTYNDFNYWEFKVFAHYMINDKLFVGGGIGNYHQYMDYANFGHHQKQVEARIWLEMLTKNAAGRFFFEHRYRAEDRFINKWNVKSERYDHNYNNKNDEDRYRFRYRMQLTVPINHKEMKHNTLYLNISDEIHLTHKKPYFNQNRFFTGLGYRFTDIQVQAGLMHQFLNGNNYARTKNYLQLTFNYVIPHSFQNRQ